MSVSMRPATKRETAQDLRTPDDAWRALVTEAAWAAGVTRVRKPAVGAPPSRNDRLAIADPEDRSNDLIGSIRRQSPPVVLDVTGRQHNPETGLEASLEGALLEDARVFKTFSRVDTEARELRMTCQAGQFSVHDAARSTFPPEHRCAFGTFNTASAGIVASVPAAQIAGATSGIVATSVYIPVRFDNTLQRVGRLAVPSADMLLDQSQAHFAVVGVRGSVTLTVDGTGHDPISTTRKFVSESLSAHAPASPVGFGPVRGVHALQVVVPEIEPGKDVTVTVKVCLMSLLAGDVANYRAGAPFYAGIDFGGDGSARLPHECLSAFEIPLTPLIGNDPITVTEIAFLDCSHENDR